MYYLQLLYSHSRQGVTYTYTDSINFTLPSSQLSYNTNITAHNFTQLDGVETNITANLMIVQQCGQPFSGAAMECPFIPSMIPSTLIYLSDFKIFEIYLIRYKCYNNCYYNCYIRVYTCRTTYRYVLYLYKHTSRVTYHRSGASEQGGFEGLWPTTFFGFYLFIYFGTIKIV